MEIKILDLLLEILEKEFESTVDNTEYKEALENGIESLHLIREFW